MLGPFDFIRNSGSNHVRFPRSDLITRTQALPDVNGLIRLRQLFSPRCTPKRTRFSVVVGLVGDSILEPRSPPVLVVGINSVRIGVRKVYWDLSSTNLRATLSSTGPRIDTESNPMV